MSKSKYEQIVTDSEGCLYLDSVCLLY